MRLLSCFVIEDALRSLLLVDVLTNEREKSYSAVAMPLSVLCVGTHCL